MSSQTRVSVTMALTIVLTIGFTVSGFAVGNTNDTDKRENAAAKVTAVADDADCRWSPRTNDRLAGIDGLTALLIDGSDRSEFSYLAAQR